MYCAASARMFSTDCRLQDDCTDYWLWPVVAAFALFAAAYFMFKPTMFLFLWKHTFCFTKTKLIEAANNENVGCDPGYVKVIFYFYQIARYLMIIRLTQLLNDTRTIMKVVVISNFRVQSIHEGLGPPLQGYPLLESNFPVS